MLYTTSNASAIAEFSTQTTSNGATPSTTTFGVAPVNSVGSYGAYTQLFPAIGSAAYGILLHTYAGNTTGGNIQTLCRIGVDLAGGTSYTVLITDILVGSRGTIAVGSSGFYYYPMYIPQGATIGISYNSSSGVVAQRFSARLMQNPRDPETVRTASYTETIGASGGVAVTPGSTSDGAWTSIGTTTKQLWWWQLCWQYVSLATWVINSIHIDLAVGDGTNFDIIYSDQSGTASATTANHHSSGYWTVGAERDLPVGSTLYARIQGSNAAPSNFAVAVVGCGGG